MNFKKNYFLMIGFRGKMNYIQYALDTNQPISLLIEKSEYKKEYEELFESVHTIEDIFDLNQIKIALQNIEGITSVFTRYESYVSVVGIINQYLNLDGYNFEISRNFINKHKMKKKWLEAGVPCADGICIDRKENIDLFLKKHSFPLILKKTSGTHSSFVYKVKSKEELFSKRDKFFNSLNEMEKSEIFEGECQLILEEMLGGIEVTVDTFVSNGQFVHTPICQYILPEELAVDDSYLPVRLIPANLKNDIEERVFKVTKKALEALGAQNCVCHTELFYNLATDDIWLIETTARGGGNRSLLINTTTDSDYDENIIKAASGDIIDNFVPNGKFCSVIEYFAEKEGYIKRMELDFLNDFENLSVIKIRNKVGDLVKKSRDGGKNLVAISIKTYDISSVRELSVNLFKKIRAGFIIE